MMWFVWLTLCFIVSVLFWLFCAKEETLPTTNPKSICQEKYDTQKKFKRKNVEQLPILDGGIEAEERGRVDLMESRSPLIPSSNSKFKRKKFKRKKFKRKNVIELQSLEGGMPTEERDGALLIQSVSSLLPSSNSTEVLMDDVKVSRMSCINSTKMFTENVKSEIEEDGEMETNEELDCVVDNEEENMGVAQAENNFLQLPLQRDLCTNSEKSPEVLIRDPMNIFWQESKKYRPNPCISSVQIFNELSCVNKNISFSCEKCLAVDEEHPEHWLHLTQLDHDCGRDRLFCKNSNELGYFIRCRPLHYRPSENSPLCSGGCELSGSDHNPGSECLLPHSLEEKRLWEIDFNLINSRIEASKHSYRNLSPIQQFIHDLEKSSLRTKYLVRHMSDKFSVDVKLLCRICFERDVGREQIRKARHVPKCVNGHCWNENNVLVLERSTGAGEVLGTFENISVEDNDVDEEMVQCLCTLKESGITSEEIAEEGRRHRQRARSRLKGPDPHKVKIFDSLYSAFSLDAWCFDEDVDDILDPNVFGEDTGDLVYGSNEAMKQNPYYNLSCGGAAIAKMNVERGTIHLHGINSATCTIEGGDSSYVVEINGRANCGPTFDGDFVEIELLETNNNSGGSATRRGTVVAILKRNTHRTARTFVCMVDRYRGNLMTPICGTLPRFHVLDKHNERQFGRNNKFHYITVYSMESGKLKKIRTMHLQVALQANMLFVVKYLKWTESFPYPLGYVCKTIRSGTDRESSRTVLNLIHEIPTGADQSSELSDTEFVDIQQSEIDSRTDLTCELTISIDHKYTVCIDDAFTVKKDSCSGSFDVWVHITDVGFTIHKDSERDKKAASRMQSVYYEERGSKPSHMFPAELATNHLSLMENIRRRAISVHFKFDSDCELVSNPPDVIRSIVTNDKKLTYEKAQKIIEQQRKANLDTLTDEVEKSVLYLHHIAKKLKARRIKNAQHYYDYKIGYKLNCSAIGNPFSSACCHDSECIVEEFMILTNKTIATFLVDKLRSNQDEVECLPFVQQKEPDVFKQTDWKSRHANIKPMSFFFDQFEGLHLPSSPGNLSHVWMLDCAWKALMNALESHDAQKVRMIVGSERLHPFHYLALKEWFDIQEPSEYACAGLESQHYGLRVSHYVHFTSPIRRYMDIVVHRLVTAVLDRATAVENTVLPYSTEELQDVCKKANVRRKDLKSHKAAWSLVKIADMLSTPHFLPCVVRSLTSYGILIEMPHFLLRNCSTSKEGKRSAKEGKFHTIRYSNLMVQGFHNPANLNKDILSAGQSPSVNEEKGVNVMWKKKYFDTKETKAVNARTKVRRREESNPEFMLNVEHYGKRIDSGAWLAIQKAIISEENDSALVHQIRRLTENKELHTAEGSEEFVSEVTSEMGCVETEKLPLVNKNVYFSLSLLPGSILPVQFGNVGVDGVMQPEIRLVHLANGKDICLEHHCKPLRCFPVSTGRTMRRSNYTSVEQYIEIWSPILELQAVTNATSDVSSIMCNHVPTKFEWNGSSFSGFCKLSERFCRRRQLQISMQLAKHEINDYLCIRCETSEALLKNFVCSVWVCHAVTVGAELIDGDVVLWFRVCSSHTEPPDQILRSEQNYCTVEFLPRILPDRRMANALYGLRNASQLCQDIVLGENHFNRFGPTVFWNSNSDNGQVGTESEDSGCQRTAIQTAISQPFTLIQGPPGTGKTRIGVKIAYKFVQNNLLNSDEGCKQVLFCGPSNSSVDAAAKQFKTQLGSNCPRLLRVYSKKKENLDFPIPRDLDELDEPLDIKGDDEISLHHIIRRTDKPYSKRILEYNHKFMAHMDVPEKISDSEINAYQKLIAEANIDELKNYDVILCTCSTSASERLTHGANIMQIIIDECGMCMEAESLIPLVNFPTAEQVVLIGDHKQLQPIIKNREARRLGLDVSLFERHAKNVHVMLDLQYRMHDAIREFPSLQFYDSKLRTDDKIMQLRREEMMNAIWPNKKYPMVFCHVEGTERTQAVTTHEANEESRSNEEERHHVIRIVKTLSKRLGDKRSFGNHCVEEKEKIAILSQYKAQCSALKSDMKMRKLNCLVSTVVASQGGEWDYVILSTVRSLPLHSIEKNPSDGWCFRNMGFICDPHQINVALTRARLGLIIVGNKNLLQCHSMWKNLLSHYRERGCLIDAEDFPRSS